MSKRKQKSEKKKRDVYFYATTPITDTIRWTYDAISGSISIFPFEDGSLKSVVSYERGAGKNDKYLTSIPCINGSTINVNRDIKNNYSYIFGVDTNNSIYNGRKISVTAIYVVPEELSSYGDEIPFIPFRGFIILDPCEGINPERIGWHLAIHEQRLRSGSKGIAMAVDSELGVHADINARKSPYYENFFLPNNLTLVYGSTDHKSESIVNGLLYMCDKASSDIIGVIKSEKLNITCINKTDDPNYYGAGVIQMQSSQETIIIHC